MKDFYLTPRGDLSIENVNTNSKKMQINFITSFSNALCLNFFVEDVKDKTLPKTALKINFEIEKPIFNKDIKLISGEQCMEQALKIRLASALGSIRANEDIGSTLENLIHELIDDKTVVSKLKECIKNAIKDLIPNPIISISQPKTRYVDYSDSLNVIIIDEDKEYSINL